MNKTVSVLLPCRAGSERIKRKNTKPFAGGSLVKIKIDELLKVESIAKIIVSTDDDLVKDICLQYDSERVLVNDREPYYASSECSNSEFIRHFAETLDIEGHLLWTHVTSPFCSADTYKRAIKEYFSLVGEYDSLVSVNVIRGYLWGVDLKPLSYDLDQMGRWPLTQDIDPAFLINSALFLIPMKLMRETGDRVGKKPYLFEIDQLESFDIDWPKDFELAEKIWKCL